MGLNPMNSADLAAASWHVYGDLKALISNIMEKLMKMSIKSKILKGKKHFAFFTWIEILVEFFPVQGR